MKKFCDKCGKEISEDADNEIYFTRTRNTRYGYDKRINLCNGCLDKFDNWLKKKDLNSGGGY